MALTLNNREVDINSAIVEDVLMLDYPDFVDAYISYIEWGNGMPLNDNELIQLCEENETLTNELIHENSLFI